MFSSFDDFFFPKAVIALVMVLVSPFDDFRSGLFIHLNDLGWNKGCRHAHSFLEINGVSIWVATKYI